MKYTIGRLFVAGIAVVGLMVLTSCAGEQFHVKGTIANAKDSVLYFEHNGLEGFSTVDSVKLDEKGGFSFSSDKVDNPEFYRLRIAGQIINIAIDSTETVNVQATPDIADSLVNVLVSGYKQDVSRNYIFKEPMRAYSYFALFQYIVVGNEARLIFDPTKDAKDNKVFGAVATSWDTYYPGSERTQNLHNITIKGMKDERIVQAQSKPVEVDAKEMGVIDLPLRDNRGVEHHLTDLKGKVVLLDFHVFAAEGSTEYIMKMRELYNKYHDRGLEIYMVSLDDNAHFWKEQVASLPWINVYDDTGISRAYTAPAQTMPIIYLIDRGNNVVKNPSQIKNLSEEIERLL